MPRKINVTISADGKSATVKTSGFKGSECLQATQSLEQKLFGSNSSTTELTEEYYQQETEQEVEVLTE